MIFMQMLAAHRSLVDPYRGSTCNGKGGRRALCQKPLGSCALPLHGAQWVASAIPALRWQGVGPVGEGTDSKLRGGGASWAGFHLGQV